MGVVDVDYFKSGENHKILRRDSEPHGPGVTPLVGYNRAPPLIDGIWCSADFTGSHDRG